MVADVFSRLCGNAKEEPISEIEVFLLAMTHETTAGALNFDELNSESAKDVVVLKVKQAVNDNNWNDNTLTVFKNCKDKLYFVENVLMREDRAFIPQATREKLLTVAHKCHPGVSKMKSKLRQRFWYPGIEKDMEKYVANCISCRLVSKHEPPLPRSRTERSGQ